MRTYSRVAILTIACWSWCPRMGASADLNYYIPKDVLVVTSTTTVTTTRKVEELSGAQTKQCLTGHGVPLPGQTDLQQVARELCLTSTPATTRDGVVALQLVPDLRLGVALSSKGGGLMDDSQSVQLTDGMLLKGLNLSSVGRAGETLTSIARFVGAVAGILPIVGIAAQAPPPPLVPVSDCDPFSKDLRDLAASTRLWLWEHQARCDDWKRISRLSDSHDSLVNNRVELDKQVQSADKPALETLLKKVDALNDEIGKLEKEIKSRQDAFNQLLAANLQELNLGAKSESRQISRVLELYDLPKSDTLHAGDTTVDVSGFPKATRDLWTDAGIIAALDGGQTCPDGSIKVPDNPASDKSVTVAFRQGMPVRLTVFVMDQQPEPGGQASSIARLRRVSDQWQNVMHPCLPVNTMTFSKSAWAKRSMAVTFDDRGRPQKVDWSSDSNVAAVAASLANSAKALRDEYAETVNKGVQIQTDRRALQLNDLTARLERLQKQKAILDTQLQVDATGLNREASLKQQQAAADLAELQAQINLQNAQATADQNQQIDQMKVAIDLLKQQLALLQAQQDLDKARKGGGQ